MPGQPGFDRSAFPRVVEGLALHPVKKAEVQGLGELPIACGDLARGQSGEQGGGPRVLVVSGRRLLQDELVAAINGPLANFFAGNVDNRCGIRVGAKDLVVGHY